MDTSKYRVTCIIVNDFKSKELYTVNFINKQILYHSVGVINKIMWGKYHADSCPATIVILSNVATPKNCTITWQRTTFLQDSAQMLGRNTVSFVSDDCLKSVRHRTDEILHSGQRNWFTRFPKTSFECRQCLRLWAGTNSCSYNAPNVFNWRQIWWIWRPIFRWNVMSNVACDCDFWCVYTSPFWRNLLCGFCTRQLIVDFSAVLNICA